jgi:hypothetical protein
MMKSVQVLSSKVSRYSLWIFGNLALLLVLMGFVFISPSKPAIASTAPKQLAAVQATQPITGTTWMPPSPAYRVIVAADGMHRITHAELDAAGMPVSTLDPRTFRMFYMGQELAIQVPGEGDGQFDMTDFIYFYGRSLDSLFYEGVLPDNKYTGDNVYWLTYGGSNGVRMATKDGSAPGTAVGAYAHTYHYEDNYFYFNDRPYILAAPMPDRFVPDTDRWLGLWSSTVNGLPVRSSYFNISNLPTSAADGQIVVEIQGMTGKNRISDPDFYHHIRLHMNGTQIYDNPTAGRNYERFTITGTVPHSTLVEGFNQFDIELITNNDSIYLNWFELTYQDQLVAENDALLFHGQTGTGPWRYTVSGFGNDNIGVYDVTSLSAPRQVTNTTLNSNSVSFGDSSADRRYAAVSDNGWLSPSVIQENIPQTSKYTPANLLDTTNGADWIAISHKDFWAEALRLSDHRAKKYRVALVDVQQIYDQFNGGLRSPESIREFLRYTYHHWQGDAPQFVLLIGDGTSDMRQYVHGAETYIPPFLVAADPILGETAADNRYVTLVGNDLLPDMSIGRFPVGDLNEAKIMVDKTINYETTPLYDDWNTNVIFIADDKDGGGGDFYEFSNILADGYDDPNQTPESKYLPDPYQAIKIYLGETCDLNNVGNNLTPTQCRTEIVNAINSGALFTSYVGHAQISNWAVEQLLNGNVVNEFTNANRLSIFLAMACFEGFFHQPDVTPLAEKYLLHPNGGAVASWSPTGFGVATGHDYLEKGLFLAVFQEDILTLGKATDAGKFYLHDKNPNGRFDDLLDTFLLFGDPALQIQTWITPTSVDMANFAVAYQEDEVVIEWATANELEIVGFDVLRSENAAAGFTKINSELIPAKNPGSARGNTYQSLDPTALPGQTYWYKLDVLMIDGTREPYGLVQIGGSSHSLYLPSLQN